MDLGPFKHMVDDGLELRKAAFETMDTLLDGCPDRLELPQFLVHLTDGLKDDHDINLLCHIMLRKLAAAPNGAAVVVASLDTNPNPNPNPNPSPNPHPHPNPSPNQARRAHPSQGRCRC